MYKQKGQRIFKDKNKLDTLRMLRQKGYTYHSLAFIFGVDFSSIYHHVHLIRPKGHVVFMPQNILSLFQVNTSDILAILDIHPKQQKSYADYLRESRQGKFPNINKVTGNV